jgi:hypothetical protein
MRRTPYGPDHEAFVSRFEASKTHFAEMHLDEVFVPRKCSGRSGPDGCRLRPNPDTNAQVRNGSCPASCCCPVGHEASRDLWMPNCRGREPRLTLERTGPYSSE